MKRSKGEFMKFRNKTWGLLPLLFCTLLIFAADKGDPEKGKELFESLCKTCHGASGEGNEAIARVLEVQIRPLSSKEVQSQEDAVLKKIVMEGKGKMKSPGLSDAEAVDVVAFLRSLKK
jgi:cytochrome c